MIPNRNRGIATMTSILAKELLREEMSWEEIEKITYGAVSKITYTTLFINDCIEKMMFYLNDIKKTPFYKHNIKKNMKSLDNFFKTYHGRIGYIKGANQYVIADVMILFEEKTLPEFDNLVAVVKKIVYLMGVPQDRRKIVSYALLMNLLCTSSYSSMMRFIEEFSRYRSDAADRIMFLDMDPVSKYTKEIYTELIGDMESELKEKGYNKLHPALQKFFRKIWSHEVQNSITEVSKQYHMESYGI